jgi:hypothetical protein
MLTSAAFAGPQIVISDPFCSNNPNSGEIPLSQGTYSFTLNGPATLTFCNTSTSPAATFQHLNFAIQFASSIDLASLYCGGPNTPYSSPNGGNYPAFDYCAVLDPNQPNTTSGKEPYSGQDVTGKLVHEFVIAHNDTPNSFFNDGTCYYGCSAPNSDLGSLVYLSFNLVPNSNFTGLLPGRTFSITLDCSSTNDPNCNDDLFKGASFAFNVDSGLNSTDFPNTPVPEPATLTMLAGGGVAALVRRRKGL